MGYFSGSGFQVGFWPIPKAPKSPTAPNKQKAPQLWVEPAFGERGLYPDSYELYVILKNITKLVSQQHAYYDGRKLPFPHEMNHVVKKVMESQDKLGAAQLDGRCFVVKSNFAVHNY